MHSESCNRLSTVQQHKNIVKEEPKDLTMSWADRAEDAPAYSQWNTAIEVEPIGIKATVPERATAPPSYPPSTLKVAQNAQIIIIYRAHW